MNEEDQVPGAIRTSWGRLVDLKSGLPLTVAELKRRLGAAGFDEQQVAHEVALAIEAGAVERNGQPRKEN
jgi:hypothetical protein